MALTEKLGAIGNAIRAKTGGTELLTLDAMPTAIESISGAAEPVIEALEVTSNGTYTAPDGVDGYSRVTVNVPQDGSPPESAFVISGNCSYRFANGGWDWFIEQYGDRITTENINGASYMFSRSKISEIPFEINFFSGENSCAYMFEYSVLETIPSIDFSQTKPSNNNYAFSDSKAKTIGAIKNFYPSNCVSLFNNCYYLKYIPEFENLNLNSIQTNKYGSVSSWFQNCYSLRSVSEDFIKQFSQPLCTYNSYSFLSRCCFSCYSLDEIKGLNPQTGIITSNIFGSSIYDCSFGNCSRIKNLTFTLQDDGTPYTVSWKNQTIDLSTYTGWAQRNYYILNYNSGITADKEVTDDATYQALKDDPDWFTTKVEYSRYNHDSAVATINSLPDTSAYLAYAGGSNTIKFKSSAGSATDGGAISSLTPEEIAVATSRGWTVSLV